MTYTSSEMVRHVERDTGDFGALFMLEILNTPTIGGIFNIWNWG